MLTVDDAIQKFCRPYGASILMRTGLPAMNRWAIIESPNGTVSHCVRLSRRFVSYNEDVSPGTASRSEYFQKTAHPADL